MKVFKFGGTSVNSVERIQNVGHIMKFWPNEKIMVIVSAMGKTTHALEKGVDVRDIFYAVVGTLLQSLFCISTMAKGYGIEIYYS